MKTAVKTATKAPTGRRNEPLLKDIRLLGRVLGDVIREQEGREAFDLIERIRQLAVAYRARKDDQAGKDMDRLLKNLSADQSVSVIRAFSYFSHLANLAEDRHQVRQASQLPAQTAPEGSLEAAFKRLSDEGVRNDRGATNGA